MGEKKPATPGQKAFGVIIGIVFVIFFAARTCGHSSSNANAPSDPSTPPTYSAEEIQASVVDTCQNAVKKDLKDPDSARFGDDWKAWKITSGGTPPAGMSYSPSTGDVYYNAGGQVNGKNSYGAYEGDEPYVCDVIVTSDGNIHARARSMADALSNPGG